MVAAVRRGRTIRSVARELRVNRWTIRRWLDRAGDQRLDRVDWSDRPRGPRCPANRISPPAEEEILKLRQKPQTESDLGEFGAAAIHRELLAKGCPYVPSICTIGRVLLRRGVLDGRRRIRHPAPPRGWYLPAVAQGQAELDSFDVISGLVIRGRIDVEVLNAISLHGGLVASWVRSFITAPETIQALLEHWQHFGLPAYAQFDNDSRFHGTHRWPDSLGRVVRLCLALRVIPVFVPPREPGFQATIESYNGRWQTKVWARFQHRSLQALQNQSAKDLAAYRARAAQRLDASPPRGPFPEPWQLDLQTPLRGKVIFLRRTDANGSAHLLGHTFSVDPFWPHRLVRAEVDFQRNLIRFYALRRRQPDRQPSLAHANYSHPHKPFHDRSPIADSCHDSTL